MIKDINPYIPMYDSSIYLFALILCIIAMLLFYILKHISKKYRGKTKNSPKHILKKFKELDLSNPKQAAYDISKYGKILANTNESKQKLKQLNKLLEQYKYKKDVSNLDNEIKQKYNQFMLYINKQK